MLIGILVAPYKSVEPRNLQPVKVTSSAKSEVMSRVMQGLLVLLRLLQLMQNSRGEPLPQPDPLVKLDKIVTDRINTLLQDDRNQSSQSLNEEFQNKYKRLELAVGLPVDQLDKKITAYNEYRLPAEYLLRADKEATFDKRVTAVLEKLGLYDPATKVLNAILNDRNKLKELQKALNELESDDKNKDNNKDNNKNNKQCCEWDIIFSLF